MIMMYSKPKNVSYTEMAIFIDEHSYNIDNTEDLKYMVLRHVFLFYLN